MKLDLKMKLDLIFDIFHERIHVAILHIVTTAIDMSLYFSSSHPNTNTFMYI